MSVQRYTDEYGIKENPNGEYVLYADYEVLLNDMQEALSKMADMVAYVDFLERHSEVKPIIETYKPNGIRHKTRIT